MDTLHVIYVVWYVVRCIIHSLYYKIYSLFQNTYPLPQSRECIPPITSRRMYTPYFRTHTCTPYHKQENVHTLVQNTYPNVHTIVQNTYPLPQSRECIPFITSRRMYTPYFRTHMYPLSQAGECTHPSSEHIPKCTHHSSEHIPTTPITRMYTLYHKQENVHALLQNTYMYPLSQTGECTRPIAEHIPECTPPSSEHIPTIGECIHFIIYGRMYTPLFQNTPPGECILRSYHIQDNVYMYLLSHIQENVQIPPISEPLSHNIYTLSQDVCLKCVYTCIYLILKHPECMYM